MKTNHSTPLRTYSILCSCDWRKLTPVEWEMCWVDKIVQGWALAKDFSIWEAIPWARLLSDLTLSSSVSWTVSIGKAPGLDSVKLARENSIWASGNKICWPPSQRLTFSFMFYMTHFKLQCSTNIERSLLLPTFPQTPHNGKSKNFMQKQGFFFLNKSQSLMRLMELCSCQNSHWSTVAIFTKGSTMKEESPFWGLCLCVMWNITYICVFGIRRIIL